MTTKYVFADQEQKKRPFLATPKGRKLLFKTLIHLLLCLGSVVFIFPFLWMFLTAFKPTAEMFSGKLPPSYFTLEHFKALFTFNNFGGYFWNSFVVCFFTVTLGLFFDSLAGFALSKGTFPGRDKILWLILATLMIPFYTLLVPTFILMTVLKLRDTLIGLIIPTIAGATGIFIMTQSIKSINDSMIDAAKVDGCNLLQIYFHVILPSVKPALGVLAIFRFMGSWNSYLFPLVMLSDRTKYTLPIALNSLQAQHGIVRWGVTMAGSLVATAPIIIVFLFMQKQFIKGLGVTLEKE